MNTRIKTSDNRQWFGWSDAGRVFVAFVLLVVPLALTAQAQSGDVGRQVTKVGTTSADFLSVPVGARATAMGGAVSAVVNDGTSIYWNPAGLAGIRNGIFTVENAEWIADITFNYLSVILPAGSGTMGFGVTALRTGEMEVTTEEQQDGTGETFRAGSYAFALSYGRSLTDRFSIGANVKLITEHISNSTANGVALDIGTLFTTPFRGIRLGASISNFGTKMKMSGDDLLVPVDIAPGMEGNNQSTRGRITTDPFDLPLMMRIGLAGEVYETGNSRITVAVDALNPNNNQQYVNVGSEIALLGEVVLLRGGYSELFLEDSERSFTAGAGLRYGFGSLDVAFDYAYEAHENLNGVNRFTLMVRF